MSTPREANGSLTLPALTIFVSAFLLFQVQPMVGKLVLPWFGGSAGVWTTCLLFFQILLLLGYLYAHAVVRGLTHRQQVVLHGTLLLLGLATLPLRLHPAFKPLGGEEPVGRLLGLLAATVGLPYFLLSTTGPLVQAWVARRGHVPYRLFALSNLASMVALLGYPVLVEPLLPLRVQTWAWSGGFLLFAVLVFLTARRSAHAVVEAPEAADGGSRPSFGLKATWTLLAAVPSVMLMAVTSHLSTNVAPIPFLWVLPLALYLLTFILCFESHRWYRRDVFMGLLPLLLAAMAGLLSPAFRHLEPESARLAALVAFLLSVKGQVLVFSAGLFAVGMVAHGELARLRPHPRHLTGFYLRLSLGGALGGLFVAVGAPHLFRSYLELPLALAAAAAVALVAVARAPGELRPWARRSAQLGFALLAGGLAALAVVQDRTEAQGSVARGRNFYGTLSVIDRDGGTWRTLSHGTITHGGQFRDLEKQQQAVTYYSPDSGVGLALRSLPAGPHRLGVVGLGAGSLAVWGAPGDRVRFYDINPLVETFARAHFTYLGGARAPTEVVMGDARLTLEREAPQAYDVLAIDAFSSDAIPVHLLTREAFAAYLRHLAPGGVLAVHVSNRYLDLKPVVKAAAEGFGLQARLVDSTGDDEGHFGSTWILLCRTAAPFGTEPFQDNEEVTALEGPALAWTDDFSNLYRILK